MKKLFLVGAICGMMPIYSQNEWNSTPDAVTPMYRDAFVGIGTGGLPAAPLVVQNSTGIGTKVLFGNNWLVGSYAAGNSVLQLTCPSPSDGSFVHVSAGTGLNRSDLVYGVSSMGAGIFSSAPPSGVAQPISFYVAGVEGLRVRAGGKVTLGAVISTPGTYRLYVKDGILTEKVKVAVDGTINWADYVFAPDYKLRPLKEVDLFVKANQHLPGVPSAEEVVASGIDVATMDAKLLEKIEELTLYIIELEKRLDAQQKEINGLKRGKKK